MVFMKRDYALLFLFFIAFIFFVFGIPYLEHQQNLKIDKEINDCWHNGGEVLMVKDRVICHIQNERKTNVN
jgi:hypothetical protein